MITAKLRLSLFILRLSITAFFSIWVLEKFLKPETTAAIWKAFYLVGDLPLEASYVIGAVQALALLCFFFGILKFWSYGFFMVIHGLGTVMTYGPLFDPYTGVNHLFWAAVPTLGALTVLFMLRREDTMFTFSSKVGALS